MKMSRRVVLFILCLLFVAAIGARVSTTDKDNSPYYRGTSAMSYRHAIEVAEGHSLTAHDAKANAPEGYVPARYRAAGAETLSGLVFRAFHLVSEMDGREFTRRLTLLLAGLCVFTAYGAASRLWDSRGAGILAAFLVAFEPALVTATNGRTFSHAIFAAFFASLYAAIALRTLTTSSRHGSWIAALVAFLLLWVWEPARYGLLAWMLPVALGSFVDRRTRIWFVCSHAIVILLAVCLFPHLVATRAAGAWTTAAVLSAAAVALLPESRRKGWRAAAAWVAGTALLTLIATPFRAGASEQFPAIAYVWTRIRYAFGRPAAGLLSDWMRYLWSADHAPMTPEQMIQLFVPLVLCAVAWVTNRAVRLPRARFTTTLALCALASMACALDRSLLPITALAIVILVSGAAAGLDWKRWKQSAFVVLGSYAALSGVVLPRTAIDPTHQIVRAAGVESRDPATFAWISFENTDRELIRFISARTSVHECIFAPDNLSALLLAFSGRTSATLCGATSRVPANRSVEMTRGFYRDEDTFYDLCRRDKIDYVLYTVDMLLDSGSYSPLYLAGVSAITPECVAVRMHFQPESLRHFTLIYENEHHRLFKVTETAQPVFLTDHPLYYQGRLFMDSGGDFEHFRQRVLWLMGGCAAGMGARARGDSEKARQLLDQCVRYAPSFTKARLELAYTFMDLGRYQAARDQISAIIQYAPDNPTALYAAAYTQVQMGHPDAAQPFLTLLNQTGDRTLVEKGKSLQYYIDHKLPLKPGAPQ
jgi:hypothetical protein